MIRNFLFASAAVVAMAGAAMAAPDTKVEGVAVDADLTVIKNSAAAKVFANLPQDLTAAITSRIPPSELVKSGGSKINVKIDSVELASSWANLADLSKSSLSGIVNVSNETDNSKFDNYTLTVAYPNVIAGLPNGSSPDALMQDTGRYYEAIIGIFADQVVKNLK